MMDDHMKKKKVEERAGNEQAPSFCALDKQRSHYMHEVEGPSVCGLCPLLCSKFRLSPRKCLMFPPPFPDVFTETYSTFACQGPLLDSLTCVFCG